MSRTTLTAVTAGGLAALSLGVMALRYHALGAEVKMPAGPGTWKVTLMVHGVSAGDARLSTPAPLDFGRQHVLRESFTSTQLLPKAPDNHKPERRPVAWQRRVGQADGTFKARSEFYVSLDVARPSVAMRRAAGGLYAPPAAGEHLDVGGRADADAQRLADLARRLSAGLDRPADVIDAVFRHVRDRVPNDPTVEGATVGLAECLRDGGDSAAKSRLLIDLLRRRGVPARLLTGLVVGHGPEQHEHFHCWVEAWDGDRWLPLCPFYGHSGKVPTTYLVFAYGDQAPVRGRHVKDLRTAFLVEKASAADLDAEAPALRRFFRSVSLFLLPPAEQRLAEFLLMLPCAALIICVYRNLIGLNSFGTFAPALVGLAFRDLCSLPGMAVFVSIVLVGWVMRRVLDRYHLLQVPRVALMLSLIVSVLLGLIVLANRFDVAPTRYIALFPMIILTGMVERFWTREVEDGTAASFKVLFCTMLIAATIAVVLSVPAVVRQFFRCPETLGLVMACQLLIGRYTGYRLMELFRFRDFLRPPPQETALDAA
jgi:hypothetical protein